MDAWSSTVWWGRGVSSTDDVVECRFCGTGLPTPRDGEAAEPFCSDGCRTVHGALDCPPSGREPPDGDRPNDNREDGLEDAFFEVDGMYSATCEAFLEATARGLKGVHDADASYVTETVRIRHDAEILAPDRIREALSTLGYTAYRREDAAAHRRDGTTRGRTGIRKERDEFVLEMRYIAGIVFGAFLLIPYIGVLYPVHLASFFEGGVFDLLAGTFALDSAGGFLVLRLYLVLTGLVLVFTGMPVLRGAYLSIRMRRPNTNLLVAMTALAAFAYSTLAVVVGRIDIFFDLTVVIAASVTACVFFESSLKQRALDRLTDLTVSQVDAARRFTNGEPEEVPLADVEPGDRLLVRQGERIPVDGILLEDGCTVDEAVVTGESLPVEKRPGDAVVGGSLVTRDAAVVRAGDDATSTIDRLTTAVWALQSGDHGIQRSADRLATRAVVVVAGLAGLAVIGSLAFGTGVIVAVMRGLLVLMIASPWALGLATPLSVASSIRDGLRRGVIVFDESVFERLRAIDVVVFDKTGTLTTGEMAVLEADAPSDLLADAAALEARAAHPAAEAIAGTFGRSDDERVASFTSYRSGVGGVVADADILVGDLDCFAEQGWCVPDALASRLESAREAGRLPVLVGREGHAAGIVIVGDDPRPGWAATIHGIAAQGTEVVVLTGDDPAAAGPFADHPGITHVFADVPPRGKTATIARLRESGTVAMVGDGTNDAPALAAADLGIALGGGTALAADAADVALTEDDIGAVGTTFELARSARTRVRRNNAFAFVYNLLAIPVGVAGLFNPLTAAGALVASGGLIAINSTRDLLATRPSDEAS